MRWLLLLLSALLPAQNSSVSNYFNGWYVLDSENRIADSRFILHFDAQLRRHDFIAGNQQWMLRPGLGFQINRHVMIMGGYLYQHAFKRDTPADFPQREHRIWQQLSLTYGRTSLPLITRIRFENRFLSDPDPLTGQPTPARFENRLRVQQRIIKPLTDTTYLIGTNEYFSLIPPYRSASAFDQNRAYFAYGIKLPNANTIEIGYLHHLTAHRSGSRLDSNHTFSLTWLNRAPIFRKR